MECAAAKKQAYARYQDALSEPGMPWWQTAGRAFVASAMNSSREVPNE
jgi:hypothetical protein